MERAAPRVRPGDVVGSVTGAGPPNKRGSHMGLEELLRRHYYKAAASTLTVLLDGWTGDNDTNRSFAEALLTHAMFEANGIETPS